MLPTRATPAKALILSEEAASVGVLVEAGSVVASSLELSAPSEPPLEPPSVSSEPPSPGAGVVLDVALEKTEVAPPDEELVAG